MLFWSTGLRNREHVRCREEIESMARRHMQSIPTRRSASTHPNDIKHWITVSRDVHKNIKGHTTDHDGFLEEAATAATTLISIPSDQVRYSNATEREYFRVGPSTARDDQKCCGCAPYPYSTLRSALTSFAARTAVVVLSPNLLRLANALSTVECRKIASLPIPSDTLNIMDTTIIISRIPGMFGRPAIPRKDHCQCRRALGVSDWTTLLRFLFPRSRITLRGSFTAGHSHQKHIIFPRPSSVATRVLGHLQQDFPPLPPPAFLFCVYFGTQHPPCRQTPGKRSSNNFATQSLSPSSNLASSPPAVS